jgi:hypothetical protein
MGLFGHLLERFGDARSLDIVRTTGAAGVTRDTFPDKKITEGILPLSEENHSDETVRRNSRGITHRATRSASPALITGQQVLTRTVHHFLYQVLGHIRF